MTKFKSRWALRDLTNLPAEPLTKQVVVVTSILGTTKGRIWALFTAALAFATAETPVGIDSWDLLGVVSAQWGIEAGGVVYLALYVLRAVLAIATILAARGAWKQRDPCFSARKKEVVSLDGDKLCHQYLEKTDGMGETGGEPIQTGRRGGDHESQVTVEIDLTRVSIDYRFGSQRWHFEGEDGAIWKTDAAHPQGHSVNEHEFGLYFNDALNTRLLKRTTPKSEHISS